ncbi:hypothetical protein, partial [Enterobacter hormaechei]
VRVVFALGLLLPGGGAATRPTKTYARGTAPPPAPSCAFIILTWCISIEGVSLKQKPPHHNKN